MGAVDVFSFRRERSRGRVRNIIATINATVPPGGKGTFDAPVAEPEGSGIFRVTLYTNQMRMDVVGDSRQAADLNFPILFTTGNRLGVHRYKKRNGMQ
jgi:hypothetical protein